LALGPTPTMNPRLWQRIGEVVHDPRGAFVIGGVGVIGKIGAQRVDGEPGLARLPSIRERRARGCNSRRSCDAAIAQHDVWLECAHHEERFAQRGPAAWTKPHVEAHHVDATVVGEKLKELGAVASIMRLTSASVGSGTTTARSPNFCCVNLMSLGDIHWADEESGAGGRRRGGSLRRTSRGERSRDRFDVAFVGGVAEFLDDVAAERGLHDGVSEVAGFEARATGSGPVGAAPYAGFGVEHGKASWCLV